ISISDADATAAVTTTLSVLHGTLTVDATGSGGLPAGGITGNGTNTVTLTGSVAQINATLAALTGLSYLEQGNNLSDTLTIATQDQGTSPLLTATNTVAINVTEVNDASNVVPGTQSATEGIGKAIAGISISDADATAAVTTTLSVLHGTLTVDATVSGGLAAGGITGNGTNTVTLTGSVAQINATLAALTGLSYLEQGNNLSDTLTIATQDQGTSPLLTATNTVAINVTEVNDASNVVPGTQSATEGIGKAIAGISISDADATAAVTTTLSVLHGTLTVDATVSGGLAAGGITGNGTNTVSLTGSVAQINATLAALTGLSYLEQGNNLSDTLTIATQDQGTSPLLTATNTVAFRSTEVNDASNVVPGTQSATEGVGKAIAGISISDADATAAVTTTLSVLHGTLTVDATVSGGLAAGGITGNGTNTVSLTGSVAQINATLAALTGLSYLEQGNNLSDTLTIATQDQGTSPLLTATNTVAINVTEVNDASNVVPGTQSATEGIGKAIAGISISDADATAAVTTTLSVLHGTLTVDATVSGGLAAGGITGNGTNTVTLTGSVAQINATLAALTGLSYLEQGNNLSDTLTIATQDQGTSPLLTATNTVAINVTEVNDASNVVPGTQSATEGIGKAIAGISISDADATAAVTTTLSVLHGTLTVDATVSGGLAAGGITGNGTNTVTLTGSVAQINATLAALTGLSYLEQGNNLSDTLTIATQDQGTSPLLTATTT